MLDRIFSTVCDMLETTGSADDRDADTSAPTGPLWKYAIPGSRSIVPFIRDYARLGQVAELALNGRPLATLRLSGEPSLSDTAATVPYARKLFDATVQACTAVVPFSCHPKAESLLMGEWTEFGRLKIRLGSLIPKVTWEKSIWSGEDAVIRWETSPGARAFGPLGLKEWSAQIPEIRFGEFKGRIVFSRPWMTFGCPDLEWA